ncbi:MAG: DUF2059 domain-containing protein [Chitinophagaceae bacterium]|nr:DUF2059 domain-containing protein [Chitinophagaceae bacterium]
MRIVFVLAILFCSTFSYSQATTPKQQQILKMIELTGTKKLLDGMKVTMKENYRKNFPDIDPKFWDDFFTELSSDNLVNMIVPIYDKHFTEEDIKGLVAFYESPLGKRMIEKLPLIMQESMAAGQQWGMELGKRVQAKLHAEEN